MKHFFTWKVFRRLLIAFAALITLVAVIWAVENFRGNRAWAKYKAELEAKGESVDLKAMVPPQVPDEKNFALSPFFEGLNFSWEKQKPDFTGLPAEQTLDVNEPSAGKEAPKKTQDLLDLAENQAFFRGNTNYPQATTTQSPAEDVLVSLSRYDQQFEILHRAAQERPLTRFPVHYEDGIQMLLPHLNVLGSMHRALRLHAAACLDLKRSDEAFRDAQLAFRLADSIQEEPLLISHMVRISLLKQSTLLAKEGLVRHAWNEEQLKHLQDYFAGANVLLAYQTAMRGECTFGNDLLEAMGRGEYSITDLTNPGQTPQNSSVKWFLPRGWLRQNQRYMAKMHQDFTLPAVDPKAKRVFPEIVAGAEKAIEQWKRGVPNPHNMFAPLLLPAVISVSKRAAEQQTICDQAMLACALERYYFANNKTYPESLQDLAPQFVKDLPHDVISGAPLRYERTANGLYRIYSSGWNGKDDGGKTPPPGAKKAETDWVWEYPAN